VSKTLLFIPSNTWTNWGGSERMWVELALLYQQKGDRIAVYTKQWKDVPKPLQQLYAACSVYYHGNDGLIGRVLNRLFNTAGRYKRFAAAANEIKPQLAIISQGANTDGLVWMEYCQQLDIPYITISQAAQENNWPDDATVERLSIAFSHAVGNLFVSRANKDLTERQIGTLLKNSIVVANPFNVPYDGHVQLQKKEQDAYQIACVARFELHAKGQDVLIATIAQEKWKQRNLHINLYGDGVNKQHVQRLINLYGVGDKVRIAGYETPLKIWEQNEALVLPSRYEGLPLALVEAMLCNRMAIVTDVSGNAEVMEDNVNGFIAAAPQIKYLDEALERAWAKRQDWERMGRQAGVDIRKIIPTDPIQTLMGLIEKLTTHSNLPS